MHNVHIILSNVWVSCEEDSQCIGIQATTPHIGALFSVDDMTLGTLPDQLV